MIGRVNELQYLEKLFEQSGSSLVILYGQRQIGKTTLIKELMKGKESFYYLARSVSPKEQCIRMSEELAELDGNFYEENYEAVFQAIALSSKKKKLLVIDEFHYMVKGTAVFLDSLLMLLHHEYSNEDVMVVLVSSAVNWVENSMISQIGKAAYSITGFVKLKSFSFREVLEFYPSFTVKECVVAAGILGAVPGMLRFFDDKLTIRDNICQNILKHTCYLYYEGSRLISEELREPSVYQAILSGLSQGKKKLNDLHHYTGFSRAKISVYLKHLMELEIVEKVFSIDTEGRENTKKGVYQISNQFAAFWFRFLFANMSKLELLSEEELYDYYIAEGLDAFVESYYVRVCKEYLLEYTEKNQQFGIINKVGQWIGKNGKIDIVANNKAGELFLGCCNWQKEELSLEDFNSLKFGEKQSRLKADYYCLFSAKGIEPTLAKQAENSSDILIFELDKM